MNSRQQVLYLWLAEGALDTHCIGWAFYDGADGTGPELPAGEPPYEDGVAALQDGWFLMQSPAPYPLVPGAEHGTGYLPNEFVFTRTIDTAPSA